MFLLIFESIGAPELLVILVVALIIFGPRKLPDLSRSLARTLGEFRRHSDEFKRTWEREVEMETAGKEARISEAIHPEDNSILGTGEQRSLAVMEAGGDEQAVARGAVAASEYPTEAVIAAIQADAPRTESPAAEAADSTEPTRKRDWL